MLASAAAWLIAFTDPTMLRPERLLERAEVTLDLGAGGAFSQTTRTPTGTLEPQPYDEGTLRLRVGVGLADFLKAELVLPLIDTVRAARDDLGIIRFGDPTVGLTAGGKVALGDNAQLQLAPLAELTFPTHRAILLRPRTALLDPVDRGIVVSTGGVSAVVGAMAAFGYRAVNVQLRLSGRGFYRVRSADASHGAGFDLRAQAVLLEHLLLGARVDGLWGFFGFERGMASPSRLSDAASWVDATLEAGARVFDAFDAVAAFSVPVWVGAGPYPYQFQALLSYAIR